MIEQALCPVLIGREEELAVLEDALAAASRGQGRLALIAGEAGLGKTRLATEARRQARAIGFTTIWGHCAESELALPYIPFLEAIGNHLATADLDAIRPQLGSSVAELSQLFPQLDPGASGRADGSSQAKLRLFEGLVTLLNVLAMERGLLLVIEDLHWADPSTREFIDYLVRRLAGSHVMVLGSYRRDEIHRKHPLAAAIAAWRRSGLADVIELRALEPASVEAMIGAIFDREVTADFRDLLFQRSEGNPFVLEEMLKDAIDRGDVFRTTGGRWERKDVAEVRIPQTVADTILARVERLDPDHADVVRAASVLGRSFTDGTLSAVTGLGDDAVLAALRDAIQHQLIEDDPMALGRYRFRHALTRESVYEDLILPERRRYHARAAEVLGKDPSVPPVDLAQHLLAAGMFAEAVPVCIAAAQDAVRHSGFREAADLYERVLPYAADGLERARLLGSIGEAHWLNGENPIGQRYLKEAVELLDQAGETADSARFRIRLGRAYWEAYNVEQARATYEEARRQLEEMGPSEELAHVYGRLAGLRAFDVDPAECMRLAERGREIAIACGCDSQRVFNDIFVGMALCYSGRYEEGLARISDAAAEAHALGEDVIEYNSYANACVLRYSPMRATEAIDIIERFMLLRNSAVWEGGRGYFGGVPEVLLGNLEKAESMMEASLTMCRERGLMFYAIWLRMWLAQLRAERMSFAEALAILPRREEVKQMQEVLWLARASVNVHLAVGDVATAASIARSVVDQTDPLRCFGWMLPVLVDALVADGDASTAETYLDAAVILPDEQPWMDLARGRLLRDTDGVAAAEPLARALEGFSAAGYRSAEMRARLWLGIALAGSGAEAAAEHLRSAFALARSCGSELIAVRAREAASRVGIELAESASEEASDVAEEQPIVAGERLVTVLFADVRGYTAMTNREAPADLVERVGALHRWAQREIERRRGIVDKFAGDAVMATFNVSGHSIDHAVQALEAAISLQDRAGLADLPVGVGIACGPAVVGRFARGANVSVLGEATNLAARLQAQAQAGEIVLSEEAYRRVKGWLAERAASVESNTYELKGFSVPVTGYAVRSADLVRSI